MGLVLEVGVGGLVSESVVLVSDVFFGGALLFFLSAIDSVELLGVRVCFVRGRGPG